jgi:hypothetical protein
VQGCCNINIWAALTGAAAYFFVGAIWYSPVLFSKTWMQETKITPDKSKSIAGLLIGTFIITVIEIFVLSWIVSLTGCNGILGGLIIGLATGLGFVATTLGVTFLYEGRSMKLFFIDAGYHIVGLSIAGSIIGAWR